MDFQDKVFAKLDDIQKNLTEIKVDSAVTKNELSVIKVDLADHIEGVKQTRVLIEQNKEAHELRLFELEKKNAQLATMWKVVGGILGLTISVLTILKFFI